LFIFGGKTQQEIFLETTQALSPLLLMSLSIENEQDPQKSLNIHALYQKQRSPASAQLHQQPAASEAGIIGHSLVWKSPISCGGKSKIQLA
jgi:hypothetical protein